jgi:hypothetical protein
MRTPSTGKLGFGRFVLQDIPVFGEHAVGHSDNIGGDPIPGPSKFPKTGHGRSRNRFQQRSGPARISVSIACS